MNEFSFSTFAVINFHSQIQQFFFCSEQKKITVQWVILLFCQRWLWTNKKKDLLFWLFRSELLFIVHCESTTVSFITMINSCIHAKCSNAISRNYASICTEYILVDHIIACMHWYFTNQSITETKIQFWFTVRTWPIILQKYHSWLTSDKHDIDASFHVLLCDVDWQPGPCDKSIYSCVSEKWCVICWTKTKKKQSLRPKTLISIMP